MPIRINLLAESQAAEELRRKDPVKRAIYVAVVLAVGMGVWAASLQWKVLKVRGALTSLQTQWSTLGKDYQLAVDGQRQVIETEQKLTALKQLTSERFLWGTALNAFQQTLNEVEDVHLVRLRTEQNYTTMDEVKPSKSGKKVMPGHPASATERITLTIDAVDSSAASGARVSKFKDALSAVPYFKENLKSTNGVMLINRSAPQKDAAGNSSFVSFTLQSHFPERTR